MYGIEKKGAAHSYLFFLWKGTGKRHTIRARFAAPKEQIRFAYVLFLCVCFLLCVVINRV